VPRTPPPEAGTERETLTCLLDSLRATAINKVAGLTLGTRTNASVRAERSRAPASTTARGPEMAFTLRYALAHMIEETARHCGHLDLLRERIDGQTGE
jgi:hypothetical protein